jgi:4-hydroxybenzoate polyprenyltransferase
MGFNRVVDADLDARNPRTAQREIPAGKLTKDATVWFIIIFSGIFVFASAMLNQLCLYFSLPVLAILFFYSYTKRFTVFCHLYLGFSISLAPLGTWIALTDSFYWPIALLSLSLLTYIAGFDILYACQDVNFDKDEGLLSFPARFGVKKALVIASLLHVFSFFFFLMIHIVFDMNFIFLVAVGLIGLFLVLEHRLVEPDDLSHINIAFFHVNSLISVTLFIGVLGDELMRRW